jgi:hypothetical protein
MKSLIVLLSITATLVLMACGGADSNPAALSTSNDLSLAKHGADNPVGTDDRGVDNGGVDINPRKGDRVEGTIGAIDLTAGKVRISSATGNAVVVFVVTSTKIERNTLHASLGSLKVGDRGQARVNPATMVASKLEATGE